jgi:hypothetical protein
MRKVQFLMFFSWFLGVRARSVPAFFLIDFRLSIDYFCEFFSFYLMKICYFSYSYYSYCPSLAIAKHDSFKWFLDSYWLFLWVFTLILWVFSWKSCTFSWILEENEKYDSYYPLVVSQLFWLILGILLTIFVSFFVLFNEIYYFLWILVEYEKYELVVSQLFWLILGILLTIFVSFFVLFNENLLFFCARTTRTVPALFISYFVSFILVY